MKKILFILVFGLLPHGIYAGFFGLFKPPTDEEVIIDTKNKINEAEIYFGGIYQAFENYNKADELQKSHFREQLIKVVQGSNPPIHGWLNSLCANSKRTPLLRFSQDVVAATQQSFEKNLKELNKRQLCEAATIEGACEKIPQFLAIVRQVKGVVDQSPEIKYERAEKIIADKNEEIAQLSGKNSILTTENYRLTKDKEKLQERIQKFRERYKDYTL